MGRVRTKTVKKAARVIVEKYYGKLTLDFQINKKITEEVATIPSKRLRNKIAGFTTHLMKRIQKGPVRGISLKLQEEERERRMEFVPERSEVNTDFIQVDADTRDMLKESEPCWLEVSGGTPRPRVRRAPQAARVIVEKYYGKLTLDFQHRPQEEAVVSPPRKALNDHHPKFMAQGQSLTLPLNSNVDGGSQVALSGASMPSPRSPEAVTEEEHLRRIFGPRGLPPTPRPQRGVAGSSALSGRHVDE
ncbi:unnamed protein product [Durusdinium trenchii]|uniref:40S ribosomal protein S17 n=1 Tax=Durusdinium trenchii TaxID=1381693 RepID=A0ABP0I980_9DINO